MQSGVWLFFSEGMKDMTRIEELELAVSSLPKAEYSQFRQWFLERDWEAWDRALEEDAKNGKLDFLVREAIEAKRYQRLKDL
jgi:hypothetical protein